MDNNKQAQEALLQAVDIMVDNKLKKINFNYYVDGVIKKDNGDGTYNVLINGTMYNNIPSEHKLIYSVGSTVQILIKNGDWNKKFIDDKSYHNDYMISQQYKSIDGTGVEYPLICDNGANIWIGALKRTSHHHAGKNGYGGLYISSGYDFDNGKGKETIYVCVPNDENSDGTNYKVMHSGNLSDYVYPVGSICIRETKTDPVNTLSGTWTLVDKEFASLCVEDSNNTYFTPNSDAVSSCVVRIVRTGHMITIKLYLNILSSASLTDTATTLGTFNYEALGITEFPTNRSFPVGYTDGGNAIIMGYLYSDTGKLNVVDIVGVDSVSATSVYFDFTETITSNFMLDTACNKFYWKRKA